MSLTIESIIFDGESLSVVLATENGKVAYTIPREAIQGVVADSSLFDRAKSALARKLASAPANPPKGGYHFHLNEADLAIVASATAA